MKARSNISSAKGWLLFTVLVLVLPITAFAAFKWYENKWAALPYWGEGYTIATNGAHYSVPAFSFIDQNGKILDTSVVRNKVWVVHYFFATCPSICPKMIGNIERVQKAFKERTDFRILSLTVDPEHDSCIVLHHYASERSIDTRQWLFGTGDKAALYRFARKGLFVVATDGDGGPDDFIHSDKLVLVDRQMHIRGYYDATELSEISQLINDIRQLL